MQVALNCWTYLNIQYTSLIIPFRACPFETIHWNSLLEPLGAVGSRVRAMTSPLLAHWNCLKQLCLKALHKTSQIFTRLYGRWNAANHLHQCERTRERFGLSLIRFYFACSIIFEVADQRQGTCPKQMGSLPQLRSVYPKQLLKIHLVLSLNVTNTYSIDLNCTVLNSS